MELLKERFGKLLLGEDMSGGGKGVSSALALSNAITNLAGNELKGLVLWNGPAFSDKISSSKHKGCFQRRNFVSRSRSIYDKSLHDSGQLIDIYFCI